jgi:RNA polymerase sigma factor (sigma-70 family)
MAASMAMEERRNGAPGGPGVGVNDGSGRFAAADYDAIEAMAAQGATGDGPARRRLMVALDPMVRGEARRQRQHAVRVGLADEIEAEDLEQEARLELWRLMGEYDPVRGPALAFFRMRLRSRLRKHVESISRRRWPGRRISWEDGGAEAVAEALGAQMARERAASDGRDAIRLDILEAMSGLLPRHQRVLALMHWRQVDQATIARMMDISEPAVRQLHRRALDALRTRLSRWHHSA